MGKKTLLTALTMLSPFSFEDSLLGGMELGDIDSGRKTLSDEKNMRKREKFAKNKIEVKKRQGLTEFFYGENSLWALNQKSADKKARKLNWL